MKILNTGKFTLIVDTYLVKPKITLWEQIVIPSGEEGRTTQPYSTFTISVKCPDEGFDCGCCRHVDCPRTLEEDYVGEFNADPKD